MDNSKNTMRKRTFDAIRELSGRLRRRDAITHVRTACAKKHKTEHLRKLHEEVAAYGHLMRQCRALHTEFIRATQRYSVADANARIKDFTLTWADPKKRLWTFRDVRSNLSVSEFRRCAEHARVMFSGFHACNHELRPSWHHSGTYAALVNTFLRGSSGALRIVFQRACIHAWKAKAATADYFVVVPVFDHYHLRFNTQDIDVVNYGVFLVKRDTRGIWTREHVITDTTRRLLWSRIRDPLRRVSKGFLSEFAGFNNIMACIGMFCATPYAPYRFTADYGRNSHG